MAKIITAYVHDLLQQVDKGEISFSRMVELINEKANAPSEGDSLNSYCGNTNTTKDNCQVLAKKSNNCKGCEYRVFEPSEGEYFRKVYIKSEDDLPRDDANYVCKVAGNDKTYVFEAQIIRDYGLSIDWYLLPVSEPKEEGKVEGEIREILIDFASRNDKFNVINVRDIDVADYLKRRRKDHARSIDDFLKKYSLPAKSVTDEDIDKKIFEICSRMRTWDGKSHPVTAPEMMQELAKWMRNRMGGEK